MITSLRHGATQFVLRRTLMFSRDDTPLSIENPLWGREGRRWRRSRWVRAGWIVFGVLLLAGLTCPWWAPAFAPMPEWLGWHFLEELDEATRGSMRKFNSSSENRSTALSGAEVTVGDYNETGCCAVYLSPRTTERWIAALQRKANRQFLGYSVFTTPPFPSAMEIGCPYIVDGMASSVDGRSHLRLIRTPLSQKEAARVGRSLDAEIARQEAMRHAPQAFPNPSTRPTRLDVASLDEGSGWNRIGVIEDPPQRSIIITAWLSCISQGHQMGLCLIDNTEYRVETQDVSRDDLGKTAAATDVLLPYQKLPLGLPQGECEIRFLFMPVSMRAGLESTALVSSLFDILNWSGVAWFGMLFPVLALLMVEHRVRRLDWDQLRLTLLTTEELGRGMIRHPLELTKATVNLLYGPALLALLAIRMRFGTIGYLRVPDLACAFGFLGIWPFLGWISVNSGLVCRRIAGMAPAIVSTISLGCVWAAFGQWEKGILESSRLWSFPFQRDLVWGLAILIPLNLALVWWAVRCYRKCMRMALPAAQT
ncbi:MAG: hypothetical protein NTW86_03330 [Candidatus Sumerlaeota bacterium]|nr:hypothetical protein [Candidatus Sumerlaeota bacterium]